jgi:hypothetical protein
MKKICAVSFFIFLLACSSAFAVQDATALSVNSKAADNSNVLATLGLSPQEVYTITKRLIELKGLKVTDSKSATGGREVIVIINASKNGLSSWAVAVSVYGTAKGAVKVSDSKQLAYYYASGLSAFGSTPQSARLTRDGAITMIISNLNELFQGKPLTLSDAQLSYIADTQLQSSNSPQNLPMPGDANYCKTFPESCMGQSNLKVPGIDH